MAKKRGVQNHAAEKFTLKNGLTFDAGGTEVEIVVDQQLATVYLDTYESSSINLLDPTLLEFEYMQQMTAAIEAFVPGRPLEALHLGGAACALPLAWHHLRPGSKQTVVELNGQLTTAMRELFDLPRAPHLKIREGEAFQELRAMRPERFDVLVRDVFTGAQTPTPLRTLEFYQKAYEVLRPGGLLLVNCVHGGSGDDARNDLSAALAVFNQVSTITEGRIFTGGRRGNVVIVAYKPAGTDEDVNLKWSELQRLIRRLPLTPRYFSKNDSAHWARSAPILKLR
ncbi:spermidine synthase [Actinomyces urinae]|uniref:spermidine synthase n=1 Tax=Actinomyces urinae TaxID=1689268 RepID=UPI00093003C5|nr:fused MFS/spermidine synthase [Actinomyces urinae]